MTGEAGPRRAPDGAGPAGIDELTELRGEVTALRGEVADLRREAADLREQRDAAWGQLQAMRRSASWRLTWPLRRLRRGRG